MKIAIILFGGVGSRMGLNIPKQYVLVSAQAHGEAADNMRLCQMPDMMDKLVSFIIGRGVTILSDSLRDAFMSGVRAEYDMREHKL